MTLLNRNEIFLISAIGAAIYVLHKTRSPPRDAWARTEQNKATARWDSEGGSQPTEGR
jgi:hypothetical protein